MTDWNWKRFFAGLLGAAINSGVNSTGALILAPEAFNPFGGGDWRKLAGLLIVSMLVGAWLWLKKHPLPEEFNAPAQT